MAVRKDKNKPDIKKIEKPLARLNNLFSEFVDTVNGSSGQRERELKRLEDEIEDVISDDINHIERFTGKDIATYLTKVLAEDSINSSKEARNIEDLFSEETSGIFSFFHDRYKNQNLLYEDLRVICSQLFELKEAVLTTRDAIVTSDDIGVSVSRGIKLRNSSEEDSEDNKGIRNTIESIEEKFGLLETLKNHIIPNTLEYGKYYVYTVPYSKVFQQHVERKQKKEMFNKSTVLESFTESSIKEFTKDNPELEKVSVPDLKKSFNSLMENISIHNEEVSIPVLENTELGSLIDEKFRKQADKVMKDSEKATNRYADSVVDPKNKDADFSGINDCYVKLLDPRKVVPIKILDQVIGYYYIYQTGIEITRSPFTQTVRANFTQNNPREMETNLLTRITDKVVKAFNKPYLEENMKFKELILNSLIYNDIYKKEIRFQFIPVDYITEFHVNKDEEGEGQSIIMSSLFYAKLYLSLLIFKMITIITRSNDTKLYYVKQSGIDQNVANKVQEIARSVRERQINFMDLLNYNSMISKIGHAKDIFLPMGRSGERGIDFDILAGQDVQLNTELMDLLKNAYINSTGVPAVMLEYINQADYSRTLVMANAKFIGRVVGFQIDFNRATTQLYRKILTFSSSLDEDVVNSVEFKLSPPKALKNVNMSDLISAADQTIKFMITAVTGEQSDQNQDALMVKDKLYKKLAKEVLPMLPWGKADEYLSEALIEMTEEKAKKKDDPVH